MSSSDNAAAATTQRGMGGHHHGQRGGAGAPGGGGGGGAANASRPMQSRHYRRPENVWNDWSEYKSKTGRSYYYNKKTKKNIWEKPEGWDPGGQGNGHHSSNGQAGRNRPQSNNKLIDEIQKLKPHLIGLREAAAKSGQQHHSHHHHHHHHHKHRDEDHNDSKPIRPPPKKRPLPSSTGHNQQQNQPNHHHHHHHHLPPNHLSQQQQGHPVGLDHHHHPTNGYDQLINAGPMVPKRPTRAEEFKRVIDEIPKLPEYPDFEALRPLTDNNLISDDVRKLTNEPNEKQILDIIPSKTKLHHKLALNSTKLKNLRANVRRCQVMRSYLDDRLSNYRSEMKILIEGGMPADTTSSSSTSTTSTSTAMTTNTTANTAAQQLTSSTMTSNVTSSISLLKSQSTL